MGLTPLGNGLSKFIKTPALRLSKSSGLQICYGQLAILFCIGIRDAEIFGTELCLGFAIRVRLFQHTSTEVSQQSMVAELKDTPRHFYSLDEYFALEHASDARFEYWDGDIVCVSGGSEAHYQISANAVFRLKQKLEGGPCRAFTADSPSMTRDRKSTRLNSSH